MGDISQKCLRRRPNLQFPFGSLKSITFGGFPKSKETHTHILCPAFTLTRQRCHSDNSFNDFGPTYTVHHLSGTRQQAAPLSSSNWWMPSKGIVLANSSTPGRLTLWGGWILGQRRQLGGWHLFDGRWQVQCAQNRTGTSEIASSCGMLTDMMWEFRLSKGSWSRLVFQACCHLKWMSKWFVIQLITWYSMVQNYCHIYIHLI